MSNLGPELEAILAKDDTEVMLDELRELFGANLDVDSRFTIAQVITAMESSFKHGVEHAEMISRAFDEANRRAPMTNTPSPDEDRELKLDIRMSLEALAANEATVDETFNDITAVVLADRAKLEEALRPFAAHVGKNSEKVTLSIGKDTWTDTLTTDTFARARAALNRSTDRAT